MNTSEPAERENDYRVPAPQRGLYILQMFGASQRTLTMAEIAERLGLSVSAIYRIVHTLVEMGYLRKVAKNTYELGPQVVSDGFSYLASRDLVDIALPHLNGLRDRTSLSCHLTIREHTDNLYIYRAFAAQRLSVNIPIGTRIPCHCSAMGRILLTALPEEALENLYRHARLDDYPPPAPKTLPELQQLIHEDRERGWVLHHGDRLRHSQSPWRGGRGHQPVRAGSGHGRPAGLGALSPAGAAQRRFDLPGARGNMKGRAAVLACA